MLTAIADRAGKSFPVHAHKEGFARWKGGGVSIEEETATSVVAKVRGQRTRDVIVRHEKGQLLVGCSCPARTFDLPGCKHAWATLLEIDRRGALPNLRATRASLPVSFLEPSPPVDSSAPEPQEQKVEKKKKRKEKKETRKKPQALDAKPAKERDPASRRGPRPASRQRR
jgi:hypothetical protein